METRNDYPRPQLKREAWINLNGAWHFAYDDDNEGIRENWVHNKEFSREIQVPFTYQCERSGIHERAQHDILWYRKRFDLSKAHRSQRLILHFGAVDYRADVWVNGEHLITHEGGHVPFSVEITHVVKERNEIVLRAEDYTSDLELPRGKQYWQENSEGIFYTATTGIWQTVWIEPVGQSYIRQIWLTPDIDEKMIELEYEIDTDNQCLDLEVEIRLGDILLIKDTLSALGGRGKRKFHLDHSIAMEWHFYEKWTWHPEHPVLFDMTLKLLEEGEPCDVVDTYFGMRKVSIVDGVFMLNNHPYYQKLLLDQGYWEESLMTAPSDEALVKDIEMVKAMGFNGVRKHQKIEDPRFLYHADRLGILVWGEMANAYIYSRQYVHRMTNEWMEMIERDYNHPSIVAWTPLNESWGVDGIMLKKEQQAHSVSMINLTKSLDQTRPVISNDGWQQTATDLLTIHDYEWKKDVLKERYSSLQSILKTMHTGRGVFAVGWDYHNQPILVSEFGGICYQKSDWDGWGYSMANSEEDFCKKYYDVVSALLESPLVQGFCYTQLADVEQEINGLLTYDRKPKVDVDIIRQINEGKWKPEGE